jgi:hypothetical protein
VTDEAQGCITLTEASLHPNWCRWADINPGANEMFHGDTKKPSWGQMVVFDDADHIGLVSEAIYAA